MARSRLPIVLGAAVLGLGLVAALAQDAGPAPAVESWLFYPAPPRAPEAAPNILLVLTDDVGFSAASTFGGAIPTPTLDALAANGLRFTRFHNAAMCSPTRAALLTGRNHHAVGFGAISDVAVDQEGYTSVIPRSAATIAQVLRNNGYDTSFFGKNHNTPDWETGPLGPFDRWPAALGFDYFYGFNGAATDQFYPELIENRNTIRRDPADTDYTLDRDLSDHMLQWLRTQHTLQPDKPFFMYLAPAAMHGPQQAPDEWIEKFRGKFDAGWDVMREEIFERQKQLGIIPDDATFAPRPEGIPAWDELPAAKRQVYARLMEVAAAQLAFSDYQIGRVIDHLRDSGQLDNTMVIFIQGDNGAPMHSLDGSKNIYSAFAEVAASDDELAAAIDTLGGPETASLYPSGWAFATDTPYPWGKTFASHLGGIRNGMVISWPRRIKDAGGVRFQFGHVVDIAPTVYEAVGIAPPEEVDGVRQQAINGVSLLYSFDDAQAPERHNEQYFEMLGNRSYYKDGWLASTRPATPPWIQSNADPNALEWELYDLNTDFSQTRNLAASNPQKLTELKSAFDVAAEENKVLPLVTDYLKRLDPRRRPAAMPIGKVLTYHASDSRYPVSTWPAVTRNWQAAARITTLTAQDSGPIFSFGSRFAGYSLSLDSGVPVFIFNPTGRPQERRELRGSEALAAGSRDVTVQFMPEGNGVQLALLVDGRTVASAALARLDRLVAGQGQVGVARLDDTSGLLHCQCTVNEVTFAGQ
jgi:arylsulfatase A-like enzyme